MIAHISGTLAVKSDDHVVIDVGGVGFEITIPLSTYRVMPREGETARLLTYLHVREEELRLFGFATTNERELFLLLNSVQGVGAKMAVDVLSHLSVQNFCRAIENNEVALLCQVPGIGKKRAEKLIFDLKRKDALAILSAGTLQPGDRERTVSAPSGAMDEAVQALIALGTKPAVAQRAVTEVLESSEEELPVQELIRQALQKR